MIRKTIPPAASGKPSLPRPVPDRLPSSSVVHASTSGFQLKNELLDGSGIFHAVQTGTDKDVVIVRLENSTLHGLAPGWEARFDREARIISSTIRSLRVAALEVLPDEAHLVLTYDASVSGATLQSRAREASDLYLDTESFIGQTTLGYRMEKLLGIGGMGSVFLGVHPDTGQNVAVKVIKPTEGLSSGELSDRYRREAQVLLALQHPEKHPHIVYLNNLDANLNGRIALLMDYVEGSTLEHQMLEPKAALEIGRQVLLALEHAHSKGIIHRDLKPGNIMRVKNGNAPFIKVMDFGLAKAQEGGASASLTMAHRILGSPHYMAPEMWLQRTLDGRTDLYALGATLFELLSGKRLFDYNLPNLLYQAHSGSRRPTLAEKGVVASPQLEAFLQKLFHPDPARRYATAAAARQALEQLPEYTAQPFKPAAPHPNRHPFRIAVIGALATAAAIAAVQFGPALLHPPRSKPVTPSVSTEPPVSQPSIQTPAPAPTRSRRPKPSPAPSRRTPSVPLAEAPARTVEGNVQIIAKPAEALPVAAYETRVRNTIQTKLELAAVFMDVHGYLTTTIRVTAGGKGVGISSRLFTDASQTQLLPFDDTAFNRRVQRDLTPGGLGVVPESDVTLHFSVSK